MKKTKVKIFNVLLVVLMILPTLSVPATVKADTIGKYIIGDGSGGGGGGASGSNLHGGAGGAGGGGNDTIYGSAGNDVIFGDGSGGGAGCRSVGGSLNPRGGLGGGGDDIITGGAGDDIIFGDGFNGQDYMGWNPGNGGLGGGGGGGAGGNFGGPPYGAIAGIGGGGGGGGGSGRSDGGVTLINGVGNSGGNNSGAGGNSATSVENETGIGGAAATFAGGGGAGFGGTAGGAGRSGTNGSNGANGDANQHTYNDSTGAIHSYFTESVLRSLLINNPNYGGGNDTIDGGAGSNELFGLGGNNTFIVDSIDNTAATRIWDLKFGDKLLLKNSGVLISEGVADDILDGATYGDYDNDGLSDDTRIMFDSSPIQLIDIRLTKDNNAGTNGEISPSNSSPAIDLNDSIISYNLTSGFDCWFGGGNVNDPDGDGDWNGGALEVQITGNVDTNDSLGVFINNPLAPVIAISGTSVTGDGVEFGTLSVDGGTGSSPAARYLVTGSTKLTIIFNSNAKNELVRKLVNYLLFKSSNAGNGNRIISVKVTDKYGNHNTDTVAIGSTALPAAPMFFSASTDTAGMKVNVTFDKTMMANPGGRQGQFTVTVNGIENAVTSVSNENCDATLELLLNTPVTYGQTVRVSYTAGSIRSADTGALASFGLQNVSNSVVETVPPVPVIQSAIAGNGHVNITWGDVSGETGYKVYMRTATGSYGSELATVTGTVYDVTGLTNGITYYFAVKATNSGGDSAYSSEVSALPKTVPGIPSNVTAAGGNRQATVSFNAPSDNGGSPVTGYVVTSNPGSYTAEGSGTTITVTGLTNGVTYTFNVKAVNAAGDGQDSAASNAVTPTAPSNGGETSSGSTSATPIAPTKPSESGVDILVNGKTETAATVSTARVEDKTVITVAVDNKRVEEKLEKEGRNSVVTIPVKNVADIVVGQLNGLTVKNMETKEAVLEIKTGNVTYTLPASQINIDNVSEHIGKQVELSNIVVNIKISTPPQDSMRIVEETAKKNNYQVVVKPVEFEITCSSGDKIIEVSKFNGYVERMIAIPDGIDPSKITTGIILNSDGTFSHVPTTITIIDGKYYARINSLTNSTYSVIWSPKTFLDVEVHWSKDAVNDMGSRLVINGVGDGKFEPDRDITRAEFASIVVKALGLMRPGTGKNAFKDVAQDVWYYDSVSIANEYGIISGYGNGEFGPMDKITREQAMTMVARAMNITRLKVDFNEDEEKKLLSGYADADNSANYARASIAACIKTGIVSGRGNSLVAPKDKVTRAEVAVIIRRLLQKSNLI